MRCGVPEVGPEAPLLLLLHPSPGPLTHRHPSHPQVDMLRRAIHALGVSRALVFMNFQQRLKDAQFKLQARGMQVGNGGRLVRLVRLVSRVIVLLAGQAEAGRAARRAVSCRLVGRLQGAGTTSQT